MKIWITRESAFQIQCGGIERLYVWFSKPEFHLIKLEEKDRDIPFGDYLGQDHGYYRRYGWQESENKIGRGLSFGKVFGYSGESAPNSSFAEIVWEKLREHFLNQPIKIWDTLEKEGKCKAEDFLLELEIESINVLSIQFIK